MAALRKYSGAIGSAYFRKTPNWELLAWLFQIDKDRSLADPPEHITQ